MEHFFDHFSQFRNHLNVKAHEKPRKKKRWLLSKQYLQPLDGSEEASSDDKKEPKCKEKTKLKCAYKAALYGMKEGMLTGIFLGGCWGMFQKFNGGSLGFGGGRKSGEGKASKSKEPVVQSYLFIPDTRNFRRSINYTEPPPSHFYPRERTDPLPFKPAMTHRERVEAYEKSVQSAIDKPVSKYKNYPGNIRRSGKEPDYGPPYYDPNKYLFRRRGEKVEIVGYAFIQTGGLNSSVDSVDSDESGSPKQTGSREEKKMREETPGGEQEPATSSRVPSIQSGREETSPSLDKSESALIPKAKSTESSIKSEKSSQVYSKKNSSVIISTEELDQDKSWTESRNLLADVLEETQSGALQSYESVKTKAISQPAHGERSIHMKESSRSAHGERRSGESERGSVEQRALSRVVEDSVHKRGVAISQVLPSESRVPEDFQLSRHSGISKKSSARFASTSTFGKSSSKILSQNRRSETSRKQVSNKASENIYLAPGSKDSILVDIDLVSNGYVSDIEVPSPDESILTGHLESEVGSASSARHKVFRSRESSLRSPDQVSYAKSQSRTSESAGSERGSQRLSEYVRSRSGANVYERSQSGVNTHERSQSGMTTYDRSQSGVTTHERSQSGVTAYDRSQSGVNTHERSLSGMTEYDRSQSGVTTHERSQSGITAYDKSQSGVNTHERSQSGTTAYDRSQSSVNTHERSQSGAIAYERSQSGHTRRDSGLETSTTESFVYNKSYGSVMDEVQETGSTRTFSKPEPEEGSSGSQRFSRRTSDVTVEDPRSVRSSRHGSVRTEPSALEAHAPPAGGQYGSVESMGRMRPVEESPRREEAPAYRPAAPPPKSADPEPKEKKPSRGFSIISSINENIIVLSACNCAIVLGVICSVVSTTRASLAV